MQNANRPLTIAFLLASFAGFLDATYLAAIHYTNTIPPCIVTSGCEAVLTSEYSTLFGVSNALLGALYYLTLFILAVLSLELGRRRTLAFAASLTPIGFLASSYFVYLQLFVLKAMCFYCMISAATSTILFILGMLVLLKLWRERVVVA